MSTQHTPTPLRVYGPEEPGLIVLDTIGSPIFAQVIREDAQQSHDAAVSIVRACNAHDELVAALETALGCMELESKINPSAANAWSHPIRAARAALAKVSK